MPRPGYLVEEATLRQNSNKVNDINLETLHSVVYKGRGVRNRYRKISSKSKRRGDGKFSICLYKYKIA